MRCGPGLTPTPPAGRLTARRSRVWYRTTRSTRRRAPPKRRPWRPQMYGVTQRGSSRPGARRGTRGRRWVRYREPSRPRADAVAPDGLAQLRCPRQPFIRSGDPDMPTRSPLSSPSGRRVAPPGPVQSSRPARPARRIRPIYRALLVIGAIGALVGLPAAVQAATFPGMGSIQARAAAGVAPAHAAAVLGPGTATVAAQPQSPSGGICSVPGIGDIGGLLGFCTAGSSGIVGDLNNICQPSVPTPEPATGGIDALISPPPNTTSVKQPATLYDSYGMAGQTWAAYDLQCSDMASLVGNNIAGVVFDAAKALDRVTITVYQSAAGNGILSWLTGAVDRLITSLGNAVYFPYLAPVVILGAIWLAWQGLIRKRASRTIEGTIWMVVACAAAIWLIGRPADFTGAGKAVSDGITQALNVAFAKLPAPHSANCVPLHKTDPQSPAVANYSYTSGNSIVDTNANELWTVLVCKPWLDGEFGTTTYATGKAKPTVVNTYGRQLLWSQAIAVNEKPTTNVIQAKQNAYAGLAASLKQKEPGVYPLFTGKQWTTRLEVAFAALFAALLAGVLVLLIAITLILLKLGFLLLLVAGPFFLIIGTHPGFGRVIALRWGELLVGVLLKMAAIAIVLSVLLYAYSLIMGTSDTVLPWALKILMISLVTVAVFIYRKPFTHLFSAVGYGVIGSREAAETHLARATSSATRNTVDAATLAVPGFAAYRVARWARRQPAQPARWARRRVPGPTQTLPPLSPAPRIPARTARRRLLAQGEPGQASRNVAGRGPDRGRTPAAPRRRSTCRRGPRTAHSDRHRAGRAAARTVRSRRRPSRGPAGQAPRPGPARALRRPVRRPGPARRAHWPATAGTGGPSRPSRCQGRRRRPHPGRRRPPQGEHHRPGETRRHRHLRPGSRGTPHP